MGRERGVYPFQPSDFHDDPDDHEFLTDGPAVSAGIKYDAAKVNHDYFADLENYLKKNGLWDHIVSSKRKTKTPSRAKRR
jgi:hypothetical protein